MITMHEQDTDAGPRAAIGDVRRSTSYYDDGMLPSVAVIVLIVVGALAVFYLNL